MFIFAVVFVVAFTACTKEDLSETSKVKSEVTLTPSIQKVSNVNAYDNYLHINLSNCMTLEDLGLLKSELESNNFSPETEVNEETLTQVFVPLSIKANAMYTEAIAQLKETDEWKSLTQEEQIEFENFSNEQKIQFGLMVSALPLSFKPEGDNPLPAIDFYEIPWDKVLYCGGAALGIGTIKSTFLYALGLKGGLLTAETVLAVLRGVLAKYALGYAALAFIVYNFAMCIAEFTGSYQKNEIDYKTFDINLVNHVDIINTDFCFYSLKQIQY
jgi:hypothetical protein